MWLAPSSVRLVIQLLWWSPRRVFRNVYYYTIITRVGGKY